jgi:hypothetical protein
MNESHFFSGVELRLAASGGTGRHRNLSMANY